MDQRKQELINVIYSPHSTRLMIERFMSFNKDTQSLIQCVYDQNLLHQLLSAEMTP